jgi:hypothetical protein
LGFDAEALLESLRQRTGVLRVERRVNDHDAFFARSGEQACLPIVVVQ